MEKEELMLLIVINVKEVELLQKWFSLDQECILNHNLIVVNVKVKEK